MFGDESVEARDASTLLVELSDAISEMGEFFKGPGGWGEVGRKISDTDMC